MTAEWIDVGDEAAVAAAETLTVEIDGRPVVIARCDQGFFAVEDCCTHDGEALAGGEIDPEAAQIICPRHGARFSLKTGEALTAPAYEPVRAFKVRVENGRVLISREGTLP